MPYRALNMPKAFDGGFIFLVLQNFLFNKNDFLGDILVRTPHGVFISHNH